MSTPGPNGKVTSSVVVTVIVSLTVIVVVLIAAAVYTTAQGRDATNLIFLATGIITSGIPGVLGLVRGTRADDKVDAMAPVVAAVVNSPDAYTGPRRRSTDRPATSAGDTDPPSTTLR